jgi:hypothetical protein
MRRAMKEIEEGKFMEASEAFAELRHRLLAMKPEQPK